MDGEGTRSFQSLFASKRDDEYCCQFNIQLPRNEYSCTDDDKALVFGGTITLSVKRANSEVKIDAELRHARSRLFIWRGTENLPAKAEPLHHPSR
jgi:hypothetical protein